MTGSAQSIWKDLEVECERLGLDPRTCPIAGASAGAAPRFLAQLRTLSAPVRWRDVLPGWPAHWDEGDPDTWTMPHKPRGAHDQLEHPRGPLLLLSVPGEWDGRVLEEFVAAARAGGHPVYGAAFAPAVAGPPASRIADIVFERETTEEQLSRFCEWLDERPAVEIAGQVRGVDEPADQRCSYHLY